MPTTKTHTAELKATNGGQKAPELKLPPGLTPPAAAPAAAEEPKKKGREKLQEVFPSEQEAVDEARSRTKGPRRAFKCELNGETVFCVANNEGRAGGVAFAKAGGKVEELGRAPKRAAPLGVDGILAAVNSLPESERSAVLAQLKSLGATK